MTIIEFYQYWMIFRISLKPRFILFTTLLICLTFASCRERFGNAPIPSKVTDSESLAESIVISEKSLDSFDVNELIQYLKLHEQADWVNITEDEVEHCLVLFESNAELLELASDFYLSRTRLDQALLYNTRAEDSGAKSTDFFKKRAKIYAALGQYRLAVDYLNKAVMINGNDPDIYLFKGDIYMKLGDSISALQYKEQAFNHDSSRKDVALDLAYIYASADRIAHARALVDLLISQDYHVEAMTYLNVQLFRKEQKQSQANQLLSIMLDSGNTIAGEHLIEYFHQQNFYDSMIYYATQVLAIDSLNMKAMEAKAVSFDHKGYFSSALMYYNQMLAIDSLNKEAADGIRKVDGKIAYLRKLRERREAIPTFDFATERKETN